MRLRVAVRCATRAQAEQVGQEVEALYLNGPAGGGGVTQSVREVVAVASALIPRCGRTAVHGAGVCPMKLQQIALARSGDKGNRATLSVIALDPAHYPLLERTLSIERVRAHYARRRARQRSSATRCRTWPPCTS